jgi:FkbM family methyltransferase
MFAVPRVRRLARPGEAADVAFVTGAILLISARCHRQVPMDTRYFLVYEEADLAVRARAAGWRVMVSPYQAWHTGGGTIPGNTYTYFTARNRIWFARVHGGPRRGVAVALWLALATVPRSAGSDLLRGRGVARCRFAWHGLLDGIGPLPPVGQPFADEPRPRRWDRPAGRARDGGSGHGSRPACSRGDQVSQPSTPRPAPADTTRTARAAPLAGTAAAYATMAAGLIGDLRRITTVAGPAAAARFAAAVAAHATIVARTRRLDAADRAMAGRDWTFRPQPGVRVTLPGAAFGGAREMYCRRVYAARPGYAPARGESVVDLGANQGLFSVLAAAAGASRVIAVEAQRGFAPLLAAHARANGVTDRIELVNALVGAGSGVLASTAARDLASHWGGSVPELTVAELLDRHGLFHVDLMKIDIEGSEFALFDEPGWLDRVGRIVMEVHPEHGDPAALQRVLAEHGFASVLLDNGLAPTPTLLHARSGYLYARRHIAPPRPRADSQADATISATFGVR